MVESYDPLSDKYSMYNPETCNGVETGVEANKVTKVNKTAETANAQVKKVTKQSGPSTGSDNGIIERGMFGSITDQIKLLDEDDLK